MHAKLAKKNNRRYFAGIIFINTLVYLYLFEYI